MLFRAHRLFDGRTPKVFRDWVVEVEDGRILDVGPRSRAASGSEERRVGKECPSLCRSRWSPYH